MGMIRDWHWQGVMVNGKRVFALSSYQQSFAMPPVWALSLLLLMFTREAFCRPLDAKS
jgi:hypothetical protein